MTCTFGRSNPASIMMTTHVQVDGDDQALTSDLLQAIRTRITTEFGIKHLTIQLETECCHPEAVHCDLNRLHGSTSHQEIFTAITSPHVTSGGYNTFMIRKLPVPFYILCGSLGAGKTSLLMRLLEFWNSQGHKVGVLMNEAGEVSIDGPRAGTIADQVLNLAGGCICCDTKDDLAWSITQLVQDYQSTLIVLECSGMADPAEVVDAVTDAYVSRIAKLERILALLHPVPLPDLAWQNSSHATPSDMPMTSFSISEICISLAIGNSFVRPSRATIPMHGSGKPIMLGWTFQPCSPLLRSISADQCRIRNASARYHTRIPRVSITRW